jgi:error-prone DNA polymerase
VEYVELHCHSCYSLREGASDARELIGRAMGLGYSALALTDHDGVYGSMVFSKDANDVGFKGISGAEVTLANGHHLTLLAKDNTGWSNLCQLLTHAYTGHGTKDEPRVELDELARRAGGLIALSGCKKGEVPQLLQAGNEREALRAAIMYRDYFGAENFYLELQRNFVPGDDHRVEALIQLANRLGLRYVATNNAHYHVPERHRLQDVLVAIRHRTTLQASHSLRRENAEYYLKSPRQMAELFHDVPEAIHTTLEVAERCQFNLYRDVNYEFPEYEIPAERAIHTSEFQDHFHAAMARLRLEPEMAEAAEYVPPVVPELELAETRPEYVVAEAGHAVLTAEALLARHDRPGGWTFDERRDPASGHRLALDPDARPNANRDEGYRFPVQGDHVDAYLEAICRTAMQRKYPREHSLHDESEARLIDELRLIRKHRLSGFFLTYYDLLELAAEIAEDKRNRPRDLPPDVRPVGRGRGSSVSSLVCYLIGLSHVDPLANNLFLGRFLNDEMVSVPDIDLDFPRDIREELLKRVWTYFNQDRAALLCSFATYRVRSAIRDIGKALDLPEVELDKLAKLSDMWGAHNVGDEMTRLPEFAGKANAPIWRDLVELARQLAGMPRHVGQHVGGIVLARHSIMSSVPVEPARMDSRYVIQWDKDSVDDARMVKIDFLALGMLSLVDDCLNIIESRGKEAPDLGRIDHEETAVYDRICQGDTVGIFQIESRAQIQTLRTTQPRTLDDLAVQVAIVRPGPIVGGSFQPFMNYRQRQLAGEDVNVEYLHPCLKPVLEETLGVVLYQDQVLQIATAAANFTTGEGERLRRSMSRRRSQEAMDEHWPRFRDGCREHQGIPEETARQIFKRLQGFAAFGFPKSHAVAFALLAYESAWLRHHYPVEFYCALFNNQPMGFYSLEMLVGDARRHNIHFLPPNVNHGGAQCTVESDATIRLGLSFVQGIGLEQARAVEAERQGPTRMASRPFGSIFQFSQRTGLNRDQTENLIMAGAFDGNTREALWEFGLFYRDQRGPQFEFPLEQDMVRLQPLSAWDRLRADYELMGLSPNLHPMALLRPSLSGITTSRELPHLKDGQRITIAGLVVCRQRPGTASGLVFMLVEDELDVINVVVYADLFDREREIIRLEPFVKIHGRVQWRGPNVNLLAERFEPISLPDLAATQASHNFH